MDEKIFFCLSKKLILVVSFREALAVMGKTNQVPHQLGELKVKVLTENGWSD